MNANHLINGTDIKDCVVNVCLAEQDTGSCKCCLSGARGFFQTFSQVSQQQTSTGSLFLKADKTNGHQITLNTEGAFVGGSVRIQKFLSLGCFLCKTENYTAVIRKIAAGPVWMIIPRYQRVPSDFLPASSWNNNNLQTHPGREQPTSRLTFPGNVKQLLYKGKVLHLPYPSLRPGRKFWDREWVGNAGFLERPSL